MANKRKTSKAKGPKGKKAREAAKKDRLWGETIDEEQVEKPRKGRKRLVNYPSRRITKKSLAPQALKKNGMVDEETIDAKSESESDSSSDEEIMENTWNDCSQNNQNGFNLLLKNIDSRKKKQKQFVPNKTSNVDTSTSIESSIEERLELKESRDINYYSTEEEDGGVGEDSCESQNNNNDMKEVVRVNEMIASMKPMGMNPFHSHFLKQEQIEQECASTRNIFKKVISNSSKLNPNLVLHLSGETLEQWTSRTKPVEEEHQFNKKQSNKNDAALEAFSHVRKDLTKNWIKINSKVLRSNVDSSNSHSSKGEESNHTAVVEGTASIFSELQSILYPSLSNYADLLITAVTPHANQLAIDNIVALHILNHCLTSSNIIASNNKHIKRDKDDEDSEERRDQGYTRAKVLILLPTRSTAWHFINLIISLLGVMNGEDEERSVENFKKFEAEFGMIPQEEEATDDAASKRRKTVLQEKGVEWNALFGDEVNSDDDFKIGMSFKKREKHHDSNRKSSIGGGMQMKLYSDFYYSDIIIASPLGLKMCCSTVEDEDATNDFDFLSSIEILIAHRADVIMMQNWDHMNSVFQFTNQQPKNSNNTDFSRVRNYLLSGKAVNWRQLIFLSSFDDPHILASFNRNAKSIAGQLKLRRKVPDDEASICNALTKVRQVFQRVHCDSITSQGDCRLKYFNGTILPQLLRTKQKYTMIFIPSYFDFIAVRNVLLKKEEASFVSVTEYARVSEVSRGRARFQRGEKSILLYTGRAHFFSRHNIKNVRHLILYGIPEKSEFYPQLLNMLLDSVEDTGDAKHLDFIGTPLSCLNLFTKYDGHALERIIGTRHVDRMLKGNKSTFLFSS